MIIENEKWKIKMRNEKINVPFKNENEKPRCDSILVTAHRLCFHFFR